MWLYWILDEGLGCPYNTIICKCVKRFTIGHDVKSKFNVELIIRNLDCSHIPFIGTAFLCKAGTSFIIDEEVTEYQSLLCKL